MKKLTILLAMAMLSLSAMAQTNFRHISFAEAQKAARQEKKLIFVDFYTSWCGPCKHMANTVFPQKAVGDFMNDKFVCVKYDAEKEEADLVKRSNVLAYPTFIIFNADGTEVNRKIGGGSAESFIADIDRLRKAEFTPEKIRERYSNGERTPELIKAYVSLLAQEGDMSREMRKEKMNQIDTVIKQYFDGLNDKQRLSADNFFLYKSYCDDTADPKMQYLFANRDKASKSVRADVDSIITKAYTREVAYILTFFKPFDSNSYARFRQQAITLNVFKKPLYQGYLEVCDAYASGDMSKYIDVIEKNMTTKCKDDNFALLNGMGAALSKANPALKQRAAKLIRNSLIDMPGNNISFLGTTIMDLEETIDTH